MLIFSNAESIMVLADDRGVFTVWYDFPHEITGILQADCLLLSFDRIMEMASTLMPLKYGYKEALYGDISVHVSEIRLGYMRVMRPEAPGQFKWTPVWDFFGTAEYRYETNGEANAFTNNPFESLFTLDAVGGTVIDRAFGY